MIERIGALTGPEGVYVAGVGQHQMWAAQFIKYERPHAWLNSGGAGTMGYAVPAAMGAKVGEPDRVVWAIDGDGCFQMTNQELATCAINNIPIKVAIINNSSLGMVRQWQTLFYEGRYSNTDLNTGHDTVRIPDFVKLADAYGCASLPLRTRRGHRRHHPEGAGDQRPPRGHRLRGEPQLHGVADGPRRSQQRPDPGCPQHDPGMGRGGLSMTRHTLSVLVEDKPGVLTRVASLFARRAFNINSLAVGPTEVPGISRMTVVVDADGDLIEQVTKQLNKLVNVIKIVELTSESSVQRDHILVKVRADAATRLQVTQAADLFRASVVDVSTDSVVIEATGHPEKLTALLSVLEPFGIREIVQSGTLAVGRGSRSMSDRALRSA